MSRVIDAPARVTYVTEIDFRRFPVLLGIDPLLTGELLAALDSMGHSDAVVLADAHFPAGRLADRLLVLPGCTTPDLLRAVCSVLPLDESPAIDLMASADGDVLPVQEQLLGAAAVPVEQARLLDRHAFYEAAATAYLIVRTGETRTYGNVLVRKGVVPAGAHR